MRNIIWEKDDGAIAITHIIGDLDPSAYAIELRSRDPSSYAGWEVLGVDMDIPTRRDFRKSWRVNNGTLVINMDAAREEHRNNLRELRAPLLAKLDIDYQRADELGDFEKKAQVISAKQRLRDITTSPDIDAATTPEELKTSGLNQINI